MFNTLNGAITMKPQELITNEEILTHLSEVEWLIFNDINRQQLFEDGVQNRDLKKFSKDMQEDLPNNETNLKYWAIIKDRYFYQIKLALLKKLGISPEEIGRRLEQIKVILEKEIEASGFELNTRRATILFNRNFISRVEEWITNELGIQTIDLSAFK